MAQNPQWPPKSGLTTPIVPREAAVLNISGTARIAAPASEVFATLRNVSEYEWNGFAPRVTIQEQPQGVDSKDGRLHLGTRFTLHVIMNEKSRDKATATQLRVTDISTPEEPSAYVPKDVLESDDSYTADLSKVYRISWETEGGFVDKMLKGERFHEIIVHGENACEVRTWENQMGVLANAVKWMYKKLLNEKFQLWCDDLKKRCEEKAKI